MIIVCFQIYNLPLFDLDIIGLFEENPFGDLTVLSTLQNCCISAFDMVTFEAEISHLSPPSSFACKSDRRYICCKSPRAFMPSLDLLRSCSNVERMLSHTFFSMCITSKLCLIFKCFQYGR